jgi:hypothetical protein
LRNPKKCKPDQVWQIFLRKTVSPKWLFDNDDDYDDDDDDDGGEAKKDWILRCDGRDKNA